MAAESESSEKSKYIVYVDESGDHVVNPNDNSYPIFVLAFCVFHKDHYSDVVVPALERFKFKHFGHDQIVLHEHDIRKERGSFNFFRSPEQKDDFLDELTQLIDSANFVLISCIVDKRNIKQAQSEDNVYHMALAACMEALFKFLEEKNQESNLTHVIVECRGRREDKELELEFRRVCDAQNQLSRRLPFDIIFADKKAMSTGLQLADLVARPIGLSHLRPKQTNRAFDVLKKKFFCAGGRDNVGNDYDGLGLTVFPEAESEKPR